MPRIDESPCQTKDCGGHYYFNSYCGAFVCDVCGHHHGLARCFCGWNKHTADPEAMYQEQW
jgi:hypothetical protein